MGKIEQILFILGLIAAAVILSFIVFSQTARMLIVGLGLVAAAIAVALSKVGTPRTKSIMAFILLAAGLLMVLSGGFVQQTIFSVDTVRVLGEGDRVRITATPGAENAVVSLSQDDLNERLEGDGWEVDSGVRIELSTREYKQRYPLIKQENDPIYLLIRETIGETESTDLDRMLDQCKSKHPTTIDAYLAPALKWYESYQLTCVYKDVIGNTGYVQGSEFDEFSILVKAGSSSATITQNNQDVALADGNIRVSFEGQLDTTARVSPGNIEVYWANGAFQYVIPPNAASRQERALDDYEQSTRTLDHDDTSDNSAYVRAILNHNDAVRSKVIEDVTDDLAPTLIESVNLKTTTGNRGDLTITLRNPPRLPVVVIDVDGDFLGIEKLSGKPDIRSCVADIETKAGREREMRGSFEVENEGSQDGAVFRMSATCDNTNMDVVLASSEVFDSGERKSIPIQVTASNPNRDTIERGTCRITVTDKNSGSSDSCRFDVGIEFAGAVCSPDQRKCSTDNTQILVCNDEGDGYDVRTTCGEGQQCGFEGSGITCVDKGFQLPDLGDVIDDLPVIGDDGKLSAFEQAKLECAEKADEQPWMGWTFVVKEPSTLKKIVTLGFAGPTGSCVASFIPFYIFAGVSLVLVVGLVLILKQPQRKGGRRRR